MFELPCPICGTNRTFKTSISLNRAKRDVTACTKCKGINRKRLDSDEVEELLKFHSEGLSNVQIGKQLNVHSSTVEYHLSKHNLKSNVYKTLVRYESKNPEFYICSRCNLELPANKYQCGRRNTAEEYRYSYCNLCRNKRTYLRTYETLDSYLKARLSQLSKIARKKNLEFNLTFEFIKFLFEKQKGKCFYTDLEMSWERGKSLRRNTLSFDRVDNSKGYVVGNVVLCVFKANHIKCDLIFEELKSWLPTWYSRLLAEGFITE